MDEEIYDKALREGLNPRRTPKGWSIRCPHHDDKNNSALVFSNDAWACCFAGCPRWNFLGHRTTPNRENYQVRQEVREDYNKVDYRDYWLSLEPLTEPIKGIPASHLNGLGWRKLPDQNLLHLPPGVFIPAFNTSRTQIPFAQVRHLSGDRRFSFPNRVRPIPFGFESLNDVPKFIAITEGNTDRATLEMAGIKAIAIPSASSGRLLKQLGEWANENSRTLVACSDNDDAGSRLLASLDGIAPIIDARPPAGYKDYGELYEDKGIEAVRKELSWIAILNMMADTAR